MSRRTEATEHEMEETAASAFGAAARATRSAFGPTFLLAVGVLLFVAGLLLGFAPHYSWKVTKLARLLVTYGFDPVLVGSAGFMLVALGVLGRSLVGRLGGAVRAQPEVDVQLIVEQVALEVAGLETSLSQITADLSTLKATHEGLLGQVQTGGEDHEKRYDSIFRMAASLDHVHAKLDERLGAVAADLQRRLGSLAETVLEGRAALEQSLKQETETLSHLVMDFLAAMKEAMRTATPAPAAPPTLTAAGGSAAPAKQAAKAAPKGRAPAPAKRKPAEPAPRPAHEDIYSAAATPAPPAFDLGDELEVLVDLQDPAQPASDAEIFSDLEQIDTLLVRREESLRGDAPEGEANEFDLDSLLPEESLRRVIEEERKRRQG